jgi:hypothetical protein
MTRLKTGIYGMTTVILHEFANKEDGITSIVARISIGYSVVLRDDDAEEICPCAKIFPTEDRAVAFAKSIVL